MKSNALLAGVSGTAIGYVAGLSTSPVASLLVAALLGVAAALLPRIRTSGGTSTVERPAVWSLSVAAFFVGVALGTTLGIVVRSTNFLADSPGSAVKQWTDLGLDKATAVQRLFDAHYPKDNPLANERKGYLFSAADADLCVSLKTEC